MLYVLHRLLTDPEVRAAVLETYEDAAFYGAHESPIDIVQVKAESAPLTAVSLRSTSVLAKAVSDNNAAHRLVSFSGFGKQLTDASKGDEAALVKTSVLLAPVLGTSSLADVFGRLALAAVDETAMTSEVIAVLATSVAGVAPSTTLELLTYWLALKSEARARVTRNDAIEQVARIARYADTVSAAQREWFNTIEPVTGSLLLLDNREELISEFNRGIAARRAHILANADVLRERKLEAIRDLLEEARCVVVHGASGQGKSTLALRFMEDHAAPSARFQVRSVRGEEHARRIARVLREHANSLATPIFVHLDVSSADDGWPMLVDELTQGAQVWTLVTVREEDWRKSGDLVSRVNLRSMQLVFDEAEARSMFDSLQARGDARYPSFEDAWESFDRGGPLLEFTYLVTKHERLESRLQEQVRRLNSELSSDELVFAQAIMCASASDARVDLALLIEAHPLTRPVAVVERLAHEYFLRDVGDGTVAGLHPIRSTLLLRLLTDEPLRPWARAAEISLAAVVESDIEEHLLHVLSIGDRGLNAVTNALGTRTLRTWRGIASVLRAYLWLGLDRHISRYTNLLLEAQTRFLIFGRGMFLASAWKEQAQIDACVNGYSIVRPDEAQDARTFAASLPSLDFADAKAWFSTIQHLPAEPTSLELEDWAGLAEFLYWIGHLDPDLVPPVGVDLTRITELPALVAAQVYFASEQVGGFKDAEAQGKLQEQLVAQFASDFDVLHVDTSNSGEVRATYILPDDASSGLGERAVSEALVRIEVLRCLFPQASRLEVVGVGRLRIFDQSFADADRQMDADGIEPPWRRRWARVLANFARFESRPADWPMYVEAVAEKLRAVARGLAVAHEAALARIAGRASPDSYDELVELARVARTDLELPKCAVDPWGRTMNGDAERLHQTSGPSAGNHRTFERSCSKYFAAVAGFLQCAANSVLAHDEVSSRGLVRRAIVERLVPPQRTERAARHARELAFECSDFRDVLYENFGPMLPPVEVPSIQMTRDVWQAWEYVHLRPHGRSSSTARAAREASELFSRWTQHMIAALDVRLNKKLPRDQSARLVDSGTARMSLLIGLEIQDLNSLASGVQSVVDVLRARWHAPAGLDLVMLMTYWSQVLIVPVLHGRALSALTRRFNSLALASNFATKFPLGSPYEADEACLDALAVRGWDFSTTAPSLVDLGSSATSLRIVASRALDVFGAKIPLVYEVVDERYRERCRQDLLMHAQTLRRGLETALKSASRAEVLAVGLDTLARWLDIVDEGPLEEVLETAEGAITVVERICDVVFLHVVEVGLTDADYARRGGAE